MHEKNGVDPMQLKNLLKKLRQNKNTQQPDIDALVRNTLNEQQMQMLNQVLSDKEKTQELLSSPQAKKLLNMLSEEK